MATKKRKATRKREPRRPRPEFSIFSYMSGLKEAARKAQVEERLLASFDASGKPVN